MKTIHAVSVLGLVCFTSTAMAASQWCQDETKKAKEDCQGAVTWASSANQALNVQGVAAAAGAGMNGLGNVQSGQSQAAIGNVNTAKQTCEQDKKQMADACADAARKFNSDKSTDHKGDIAEVKDNYDKTKKEIESNETGLGTSISDPTGGLQASGVTGGSAVSTVTSNGN